MTAFVLDATRAYTGLVNDVNSSPIEHAVFTAIASARTQLLQAGVPSEALAEFVGERRVLLVRRPATMVSLGEVWRLGTLLLRTEPVRTSGSVGPSVRPESELYAAGHTTRAAVRLHRGNQSVSREERRDIAAAALHGGYPVGATVHYGATPISLDEASLRALGAEHPLGIADDELRVRWRVGAPLEGAPTLATYLAERVELLTHPPEGA